MARASRHPRDQGRVVCREGPGRRARGHPGRRSRAGIRADHEPAHRRGALSAHTAAAGMSVTESIVALRSDARRHPCGPSRVARWGRHCSSAPQTRLVARVRRRGVFPAVLALRQRRSRCHVRRWTGSHRERCQGRSSAILGAPWTAASVPLAASQYCRNTGDTVLAAAPGGCARVHGAKRGGDLESLHPGRQRRFAGALRASRTQRASGTPRIPHPGDLRHASLSRAACRCGLYT